MSRFRFLDVTIAEPIANPTAFNFGRLTSKTNYHNIIHVSSLSINSAKLNPVFGRKIREKWETVNTEK